MMTFEKVERKIKEVLADLLLSGLCSQGYGLQVELSEETLKQLEKEKQYVYSMEAENCGMIFGVPLIVTKNVDKICICKTFSFD